MKILFITLTLAAALGAILLLARNSPAPAQPGLASSERTFDVKGRVKGFTADGETIIIEHETMPGYMPAMTMPFTVKPAALLAGLAKGDAVGFRYVVTEDDAWIDRMEKLPDDAVPLSPAGEASQRTKVGAMAPALEPGDLTPNFHLTNQDGERFYLGDFRGKHIVLTFIFTRCPVPNFCPLMSENFRTLRRLLDETADGDNVQLLSITIDPENDRPEVLRVYASRYTQNTATWTHATGSREEIDELTDRFSVYIEVDGAAISHGLATAHISPDGVLTRIWRGNSWKPEEILHAIVNQKTN